MNVELFIARRIKLSGKAHQGGSPSLSVATCGVVLAIVIMILSVVIVMGFKQEVTHKIYSINPHLRINNAALGLSDNYSTVDSREIFSPLMADSAIVPNFVSMSLIAEKAALIKTDDDFMGVEFRGVDDHYDWAFLTDCLVAGRVPHFGADADEREILVSKRIAQKLNLHVGDKTFTYFIGSKVKVRRSVIVGIFNTDFDTFDKSYVIGNISLLQGVNGWDENTGNYVGVNLNNRNSIKETAYSAFCDLAAYSYAHHTPNLYNVAQIENENAPYFAWLSMLNTNVAVIIVLMLIVSSFTLIAALLMIVLERIKMVGMLKALGATNRSIRKIFVYLTSKLVIKSMVLGNALGLGLALLQQQFHIIHLNPDAYYMSYVPIEISIPAMIVLNVGILVVSLITLIGPSHIVSTIKPTSTMRFE